MDARKREDWWLEASLSLGRIRHAITGAVAANEYMPPRVTLDLDIILLPRSMGRAERALTGSGWKLVDTLRADDGSTGSRWQRGGHSLDVIGLRSPWARDGIVAAGSNRLGGMPVLPLAFIVLHKIQASRTIDLGDLSRMLGAASDDDLDEVRRIVRHWARPEDVEDLEPLIVGGPIGAATLRIQPPAPRKVYRWPFQVTEGHWAGRVKDPFLRRIVRRVNHSADEAPRPAVRGSLGTPGETRARRAGCGLGIERPGPVGPDPGRECAS
jgi:hypothetical protein